MKQFGIATCLVLGIATIPAWAADQAIDWESSVNMGAQGVQGALTWSHQDGLFDLSFSCSAHEGENRTVFMGLNTMPDAPLYPGNETEFPVVMLWQFSNGASTTTEISVNWQGDETGINIWYAEFSMDKLFLKNFAQSQSLQLITNGDEVIFTYGMRGSAKAAGALVEYCYSGDYS